MARGPEKLELLRKYILSEVKPGKLHTFCMIIDKVQLVTMHFHATSKDTGLKLESPSAVKHTVFFSS
jgi:hypothetical protein